MRERSKVYGVGINDYPGSTTEVLNMYNIWRSLVRVSRDENAEIGNFKYFTKFLDWYDEEMSKISDEVKNKYDLNINRHLLRESGDPINEETVILVPRSFAVYLSEYRKPGSNGIGVTYSKHTGVYISTFTDILNETRIPSCNKNKDVVILDYWKERYRVSINLKEYVIKNGLSKALIPIIEKDIQYSTKKIQEYKFAESFGEIKHRGIVLGLGINDLNAGDKVLGRSYHVWKSAIYTAKRENADMGEWEYLSNFVKWYNAEVVKLEGDGTVYLDKKSIRKFGDPLNKNTVKLILK